MSQSAGHGIPYLALLAATSTPSILVGDPTRRHRPLGIQVLAGHLHPELIKPAESGQTGADKARTTGSVVHVEVFRMRGVGTPIIGRPRPLPRQRRADPPYTLNCEEPVLGLTTDTNPRTGRSPLPEFPSPLGVLGLTTDGDSVVLTYHGEFPSPLGVLGLTT